MAQGRRRRPGRRSGARSDLLGFSWTAAAQLRRECGYSAGRGPPGGLRVGGLFAHSVAAVVTGFLKSL